MTLPDDQQAARVADAQQAAYFREELATQRQLLQIDIEKRRAHIGRPGEAGRRVRRAMSSAEAQLRYVDGLITGLDRRFGPEKAETF